MLYAQGGHAAIAVVVVVILAKRGIFALGVFPFLEVRIMTVKDVSKVVVPLFPGWPKKLISCCLSAFARVFKLPSNAYVQCVVP